MFGRWEREDGKWKKPPVRHWHGEADRDGVRRAGPDAVLRALARDPLLIVGIRPADIGLAVLDVDEYPDELAIAELETDTDPLASVRTRRGRHLLYRAPDPATASRIGNRTWRAEGPAGALAGEVRCRLGFVYVWHTAPYRTALDFIADGREAPFPVRLVERPEPPAPPRAPSPEPGGSVRRTPHTLAEWLAALEASGWEGKRAGREWCGPCPRCGGVDRFHVGPGERVAVLAGCRHGCTFENLVETVFGARMVRGGPRFRRMTRPAPGRRHKRGRARPVGRPGGDRALEGRRTLRGTRNRAGSPETDVPADPEAVESPVTNERHPPRDRSTPDFGRLAAVVEDGFGLTGSGRDYLQGRGLDPDRLETAGWRSVDRDGWPDFRDAVKAVHPPAAGKGMAAPRAALLIPQWNRDGLIVTYRWRMIPKGDVRNLVDCRPSDRGANGFYGADFRNAAPGDVLHVCEGEIDTESLREAGAAVSCGLLGVKAMHEQLAAAVVPLELARVVIWFDGDRGGIEAADKLADLIAATAGISARRWDFPAGMDVNDAWGRDPDGLRAAVRSMERTTQP